MAYAVHTHTNSHLKYVHTNRVCYKHAHHNAHDRFAEEVGCEEVA